MYVFKTFFNDGGLKRTEGEYFTQMLSLDIYMKKYIYNLPFIKEFC